MLVSWGPNSPLNTGGELPVEQLSWMLQTQLGTYGPGCANAVTYMYMFLLVKKPAVQGLLQMLGGVGGVGIPGVM